MDIFKLEKHKKELVKLNGFGLKSFNNLMKAIEHAKQISMTSLIASIGIKNVGFGSAKRLTKYFNNDINYFLEATNSYKNFMKIADFGEVTANSVCDYFQDEENMNQFRELLGCVEIIREDKKEVVNVSDNPFNGKTIYLTGKFNLKKDDLKVKVEALGAILSSGYKKSLDMLVCGGDMSKSGKADRAVADGVKCVTEEYLMQYIK